MNNAINWILQSNLTKSEILDRIKSSIEQDDEQWEELEIVPFSDQLPKLSNNNAINIIYGSTTFMINAYNDNDYRKSVFYDPKTFQMKNYVDHWNNHVLNYDGILTTFGNIDKIKSNPSKKWFIRPNHDSKEFSGRVDSFENLTKWSQKICDLKIEDFNQNTEVWISEPQIIDKEWRVFIVDNNIVSSSRYMKNGELNESDSDLPDEMISFTQQRINEYRLHDIYVMDIAQIKSGFKIIECNCFNGTGFYKHDIDAIIISVNNFIRKKIKQA